MKKFIAAAVLAGLATAAFAQSNQIDASVAFQAPDLTNAPNSKSPASTGDRKNALNLESAVKYTYIAKIDDNNTVKGGLNLDVYTPFFDGNTATYKSQFSGKIEPFAQYQGFGLDALTSVALYAAGGDNDSAAANALGWYTGPVYSPTKKYVDNKNPVSDYFKLSYKYAFDKTFSVTPAVETDTALLPVFFLVDVKPQVAVTWTFLTVAAKYNVTFETTNADDSGKTTYKSYLEPKLTVDVGSLLDPVKGLKVYTGGKVIVGDTAANAKLKKTRWDDGLSYAFTVKDVGTFGFDTYVRVANIGPDAVENDRQIDYNLSTSYSFKF
jgi:hypothetical protein